MNQAVGAPLSRRVAVIGAGAAGLCSAKYLLQAGLQVEVFEIGTRVGGLWVYENDNGRSSAYESLHINSEKRNTQYSDFPFPAEIQYFPDHRDMAAYLKNYAKAFGVYDRIRFKSRVVSITPESRPGTPLQWHLKFENGREAQYDAVVVATGHLTVPSHPDWAERFAGNYMHAHYYRKPHPFADQRVLVVGIGNSGCDITADLCVYAQRTVVSVRSPELIVPKIFLGVPVTQITGLFERKWLPAKTPQLARKIITRLVHGRMEHWGITTPKGATHPISHATLINHFAYRRAHVKPGIAKVEGKTVTFADGSSEEFDTIIAATGYRIDYPFVRPELLPLQNERADLYKRVVPVDWPGLYYVGLFNTLGSSNLRMFEVQCRWIVAVESGQSFLPSKQEMWEDIRNRNAYIAKRFPPGPRHAVEIEPTIYTREMEMDTRKGLARRKALERAGRLDARTIESRAVEERMPKEWAPRSEAADASAELIRETPAL
jgi:dimethylaniline monooxygenase (N-oxide forming)